MTEKTINILLLEDLSTDQILLKRHISKKIPNAIFTVADSKESFMERLDWTTYDLIVSDYNLPNYNGLEALLTIKERMPYVPFVFVTGTLNSEEKAANAILSGASGYVLKKNMDQLADQLISILEKSQEAYQLHKKKEDRILEQSRLLQNIQSKIEQMEDSKEQKELLSLISKLKTYM